MIFNFRTLFIQFLLPIFGVFLVIGFIGSFNLLFLEPAGIHYIRQTDSLSFIQHFFQYGNPWWEPAVYNLESFEGKGASEFPLFYYLIAKIWLFTGQIDWYLRFWNFLWVFAGMIAFWHFLKIEYKSKWLAFAACLLTFNGTVFWYYAPNYLPDAASFGMVLLGFFFLSREVLANKNLLLATLFIALAGLMKPTLLILPFAFVLVQIALDLINSVKNKKVIFKSYRIVIAFTSAALISIVWVIYVKYYNAQFNNIYFLFEPRPIWTTSVEDRKDVWNFLSDKWVYRRYANDQVLQIWTVMMVLPFFAYKTLKIKWYLTHLFSLIGCLCLFLLFFQQFKQHDYYFIVMIPSIGFGVFCSIQLLDQSRISVFLKVIIFAYLFLVILLGLKSTRNGINDRLATKVDVFSSVEYKLKNIDKTLDSLGIEPSDWVFILGDHSKNGGLRLTRHKGWTRGELDDESRKIIHDVREFGAKYLINCQPAKYSSLPFGKVIYKSEKYEIVEFQTQ